MVLTLSPVIINQHGKPFFFTALFKGSVFILKDELKHIPIFSRYFKRLGFIFIKRDKGLNSIRTITKSVDKLIKKGKNKIYNFSRRYKDYT